MYAIATKLSHILGRISAPIEAIIAIVSNALSNFADKFFFCERQFVAISFLSKSAVFIMFVFWFGECREVQFPAPN